MIGRLVADGKSWMYILRNYASILQMYTTQVILCNFINVIIEMKTSLIRQPFFYKKVFFFFNFIHVVRISFDLFSPFTISKYNSTLTPDEPARFDRFHIVAFFQNRPTVCRSSGDHRLTLYRWESHEKRRIVQRNFLLGCFDKEIIGRPKPHPKSVETSADNRPSVSRKPHSSFLLTENRATVGFGKCK